MTTGFESVQVTSIWRGEDVPDLLPIGFEFFWRGQKYRHKPGGYSDGLSSPQFLHIASDIDSRDWAYPAANCHDGGYHNDLEIWTDVGHGIFAWRAVTLCKDDCDAMFKELMESIAVNEKQRLEAIAFYEAVHLAGQKAFDEGRAAWAARQATN